MRALGLLGMAAACVLAAATAVRSAPAVSEQLARERNQGVAEYENEEFGKAAAHFERCFELSPRSAVDAINAAVAAVQAHAHDKALAWLRKARELDPSYPHIPYLLGIVHLRIDDLDAARAEFEKLLAIDPLCAPAHYNLGVVLKKLKREDDAAEHWTETVRLDPNYGAAHFQLFNLRNARGAREQAQAAFREYTRIKQASLGPGTRSADVEKSRYLALLVEALAPRVSGAAPVEVALRDVTKEAGLAAVQAARATAQGAGPAQGTPAAALADVDDDGDLDLLVGRGLYRNHGGRFVELGVVSGGDAPWSCADFGDFDNDGKLDLVAGGGSRLWLYRGRGDATFEDASEAAGLAKVGAPAQCRQVRFVDLDHEGDLDIVAGGVGECPAMVLRNNGNATFTDLSKETTIGAARGAVAAVALADFDGRNDIDVLVVEAAGAHGLYMNLRDGTFRERAAAAGLRSGRASAAAAVADVNGDGLADVVLLGGASRPAEVWLNGGEARFSKDAASPVLARVTEKLGPRCAVLVDLDNDGALDLVVAGGSEANGAAIFRNDGAGGWSDATAAMLAATVAGKDASAVLAGDLDNDGDQDLVMIAPDGPPQVLRNDGGNSNHSLRLRLRGRKNNPDGYGAKVWVRQGNFFVMRESFSRWIDVGVGARKALDVVGVRWPTGVTQNQFDVAAPAKSALEVVERPGLAESCPFVYAFDGRGYRFVTDILDTTPLGVSLVPGVPFVANHREAISIPGRRLVEAGGLLSLRVTQELEEITYLDRLRLIAVDHPAGVAVLPGDRFSGPPFAPLAIHAVAPLPPISARDGGGHDLSAALAAADRLYAFDCPPIVPQYPGITSAHELIIDAGAMASSRRLTLFLRGTTLWTEASVNVAVSQNPDLPVQPVALDVIGKDGTWVRVSDDVGLPAGMDKTLPIDLSGVFKSDDHRVRISTNLAVLWDQAFLAVDAPAGAVASPVTTELTALFADLRYRGYSEINSPDGKLPDDFVYDRLLARPPFDDVHAGRYTRYGDVAELLSAADDMYVILAPGDEVAVEFPAIALPQLPVGWERDYVLDADGWIKDGDLRTISGETVEPLPFHAMSAYPYPAGEHYPTTATHRRYLEQYQTRVLPQRPRSAREP